MRLVLAKAAGLKFYYFFMHSASSKLLRPDSIFAKSQPCAI